MQLSNETIAPARQAGLLTDEPFDQPIDFVHFDLWHHWGRTAKFGAWMGGPDYVQWHGAYEILRDQAELEEMVRELLEKAVSPAEAPLTGVDNGLPGARAAAIPSSANPFSRDQAFLLLAAFNQFFIAIDIYLAHNISGGIKPAEWIPIISGFVCGMILLIAGAIAVKNRDLASALANLVLRSASGLDCWALIFI